MRRTFYCLHRRFLPKKSGNSHSVSMKKAILPSLVIASLCAINSLRAASVTWTTSPGVLDTEVKTNGTQVFGYYWAAGGGPATALVNTVPFGLQTTTTAPAGLNFNGTFNNVEGIDVYQVPLTAGNAGLNQILDGQNWGAAGSMTMTGLTPGLSYQVQYMMSDDRPGFLNLRNYDLSDGNDAEGTRDVERAYHSTQGGGVPAAAPAGSREAKIFNGSFIADATGTQAIWTWLYAGVDHSGGNSGSQVNAIQLRLVPEPGTLALAAAASIGLMNFRRRRS